MTEIGFFLLGGVAAFVISAILLGREWQQRRMLERKVDRLYKHLSCGQGYLGCDAGPNCDWDHK